MQCFYNAINLWAEISGPFICGGFAWSAPAGDGVGMIRRVVVISLNLDDREAS